MIWNRGLILLLVGALAGVKCSEEDFGVYNSPNGIRVVTGPIQEKESDSTEDVYLPSWRHHVDFDERFPGEDLIAQETIHPLPQSDELEEDPDFRPPPAFRLNNDFNNDDLVVPDFTRMFQSLPNIGRAEEENPRRKGQAPSDEPVDSSEEVELIGTGRGGGPLLVEDQNPWFKLWNFPTPKQPWWKGSNVCIKRDESEEARQNETSLVTEETSPRGRVSLTSTLNSPSPLQFHMQFSSCEDLDTKYVCKTKLYGRHLVKVVKTEYECCGGYGLDRLKSQCQRGRFEDVATTADQLGGKEFLRLLRSAGLERKLLESNVTLFLPTDEAVRSFLDGTVTSNSIELSRARRSLLHRERSPAGGRNVRRHQGQKETVFKNFNELGQDDDDEEDDSEEGWKTRVISEQEEYHRRKKFDPNMDLSPNSYNHVNFDSSPVDSSLAHTLQNHFVNGKLSTDDFVDEKVIRSDENNGILRLNTWHMGPGETLKTINCVRLTSPNHKCRNGLVHLVDRVIVPVEKGLLELLGEREELSLIRNLLEQSELSKDLLSPDGHYTLFAPTNQAFQKLGASFLLKLQTEEGRTCLKRILRHHLLPISFCSTVIYGKGSARTVDLDLLQVERKGDDKLFVNGSEIVVRDLITRNGVVHIIDAVVMSENDKPMSTVLEKDGHTPFLKYAREAGIDLDGMSNLTLFLPSEEALSEIPRDLLEDKEGMRELLLYHIVPEEKRTCHLNHQEVLPTKLGARAPGIRINLYATFPLGGEVVTTAQCAKLISTNKVSCNGVHHVVDRVIFPPKMDLVALLKSQPDLTIFSRLVSEHEELFQTLRSNSQFLTLFVPRDSAFHSLPKETLSQILSNKSVAEKVLRRHIAKDESICCSGVAPNLYFMTRRVATMGDLNVPLFRDSSGNVKFGEGTVTSCDLVGKNGILHVIDKVIMGPSERSPEEVGRCLPETLDFDQFDVRAFFMRL